MQHEIEQMLHDYETGRVTRREMVTRLGTIAALMAGAGRVIGAENPPAGGSTFQATELNHIALRVTDIPRSRDFYLKHLGMEVSRDSASSAFLNFGNNFLALFRGDEAGLDHYCYSVRNYNVDQAEEKLRAAGIENIRRTSGRIYFPDPDNLTVQLAAERHMPD
ncbi:MAG TPA: VOC family protein [Methylomirabilota bacterium]|nr:VOC family protein [Methylomirabilota bacterium]